MVRRDCGAHDLCGDQPAGDAGSLANAGRFGANRAEM